MKKFLSILFACLLMLTSVSICASAFSFDAPVSVSASDVNPSSAKSTTSLGSFLNRFFNELIKLIRDKASPVYIEYRVPDSTATVRVQKYREQDAQVLHLASKELSKIQGPGVLDYWEDADGNKFYPGYVYSIDENLTLTAVYKPGNVTYFAGDGSERPVKLVPLNEDSTAMIQRGAVIETYNTAEECYRRNNPLSISPVNTETYGYDTTGETFENWFIYGLDTNLSLNDVFANYVKVQGRGYAEVTPIIESCAGTGSVIEVYTADHALVESFYIVILGDLNGDAIFTEMDSYMTRDEIFYTTNWSRVDSSDFTPFLLMAGDFAKDGRVESVDLTSHRGLIIGCVVANQITLTAKPIVQE